MVPPVACHVMATAWRPRLSEGWVRSGVRVCPRNRTCCPVSIVTNRGETCSAMGMSEEPVDVASGAVASPAQAASRVATRAMFCETASLRDSLNVYVIGEGLSVLPCGGTQPSPSHPPPLGSCVFTAYTEKVQCRMLIQESNAS